MPDLLSHLIDAGVVTTVAGVIYAAFKLAAYCMKLRLIRHALDKRGTRAAVELAHALQREPHLRPVPQLPRRRARDDPEQAAA